MNRQHRRLMQRQGELAENGLVASGGVESQAPTEAVQAPEERPVARPSAVPSHRRTTPRQFMHEVNVELRKVAWPTKAETANYATVVFLTLAVLMAVIFGLDVGFSHLANFLFK